MKITVTQTSDSTPEAEWSALVDHVRSASPDLVLLGEMPFGRWLAATDRADATAWADVVALHDTWIGRLGELGDPIVAGSRPVNLAGIPHNEGFIWSAQSGYTSTHLKYYLPDEPGFWEATWYRRSPTKSFDAVDAGMATVGYMICSDMWFTAHARGYATQGAELVLVPRATEATTGDKWLAGGRCGAVMSGAFHLSSNRQGTVHGIDFGGMGWVIDPEGNVLATTDGDAPFVTVEIDLEHARRAKSSYPRYIPE